MLILDTNFLYSLIDNHDSNHEKAHKVLLNFSKKEKFIIPYIVFAELLVGGIPYDQLLKLCKFFTKDIETHTIKDLKFVSEMEKKEKRKLKAADCLILAMANRTDSELITFDKNLAAVFERMK